MLNYFKKYSEILCLGGFLIYWLWEAKLSATFSDFNAKDWMGIANTGATLVLAAVGIWGVNSWKKEYTSKRRFEEAIAFAEQYLNVICALEFVTDIRTPIGSIPPNFSQKIDEFNAVISHKFTKVNPVINKLLANQERFEMILGTPITILITEVSNLISDIKIKSNKHRVIVEELDEMYSDLSFVCATPEDDPKIIEHEDRKKELYKEKRQIEDEIYTHCSSPTRKKLDELRERAKQLVKDNSI